ncbi:hypothetical protein DL767_010879 [Monosporascus sp. MG133]|nr:hypothetical protein DL767_010879 [Monosporascus sp. MG133]
MDDIRDVLIIGGGHAGMSAALTTYRALLKTIVFDTQQPRNRWNTQVRLTSTWDAKPLSENRTASRDELVKTGFVEFVDTAIGFISKTHDGLFRASDAAGRSWLGRKVLLAMGCSTSFPQIPGYESHFAKKIYPCMFQFGFEDRGAQSAGLLAVDGLASASMAAALADDGHRFSHDFTIYTNGDSTLASELGKTVTAYGIKVDDRKIRELHADEGRKGIAVDFGDGSSKTEAFLVHRPTTVNDSPLIRQLGLDMTPTGDIATSMPFCQTSVPGVFAAGDCASVAKIIPQAMVMGAYAGCGIARELPRRVTGNPCT